MARVVLDEVTKTFGGEVVAVDAVSMEIHDGEFMVLVGPSGCGKTTLLRIVAGLEEVTAGEVLIGDQVVTDLPPKNRDIAMVFQNYALYPHMTVEQNLAIGLKLRHLPKPETRRRVAEVAHVLGLEAMLKRKPSELSGGQRQRVAMGRAMVREPRAFLMDEPLSNLDAKLRVQMRAELARLRDRLKTTTIYVTHDQVEAMTLGDRVAVMRDGIVQQLDTPTALYRSLANLFVAAFMGSPSMNLVEATLAGGEARFGSHRLPVPARSGLRAYEGRKVALGIRPSDFEDASLRPDEGAPAMDVVVDVTEELGSTMNLIFTVDAAPVAPEELRVTAGDDPAVVPLVAGSGQCVFTAQVDPRCTCRPADRARLLVDAERLHFFDPDTGASIGVPETVAATA